MKLPISEGVDFNSSFVKWLTPDDSIGRFSLDALCDTYDHSGNLLNSFFLLSGVMACEVYGNSDLFREPSYFYQALFSKQGEYKIFRTHVCFDKNADNSGKITDRFKSVETKVVRKKLVKLNSMDDLAGAVKTNAPIYSFSLIENAINGHVVVSHYPVKHINLQQLKKQYQVETGPVIMNMSDNALSGIDELNIVYLAYNGSDYLHYMSFTSDRSLFGKPFRSYNKGSKIRSINQLYLLQ